MAAIQGAGSGGVAAGVGGFADTGVGVGGYLESEPGGSGGASVWEGEVKVKMGDENRKNELTRTELSRRIDQRVAMFLSNILIPPCRWTFERQEFPEEIVYTLYFDEKHIIGQFILELHLMDDTDGLIRTAPGKAHHVGSYQFYQIDIDLKRDLQFFYQSFGEMK